MAIQHYPFNVNFGELIINVVTFQKTNPTFLSILLSASSSFVVEDSDRRDLYWYGVEVDIEDIEDVKDTIRLRPTLLDENELASTGATTKT